MPKLKPLPVKKIKNILEKNGFECVRHSKHFIYKKKLKNKILITLVPHPHKSNVCVGTIKSIIRQSKKSREEFC